MTDTIRANGSCLCGAVKIAAASMSMHVGACHCGMCRKWNGGPLMTVDCGIDIEFEGQAHIAVFNSSVWAERGFCKQCGSHLFYRLKESGQHMVPVGLFDDVGELVFDHQVFIDKKPSYYAFENKTRDMTEAEIFALYAPPAE